MNSPRYAPAGLLIEQGRVRVAIDGGPGAEPAGPLAAWLVTDERAELIRENLGSGALQRGVRVNRRPVRFCARPRPAPGRQVAMGKRAALWRAGW